jgi:hypothetical protein
MFRRFLLLVSLFAIVTSCSSSNSNSNQSTTVDTVSVVAVGGSFSNPLGLIYLVKDDEELTSTTAKAANATQITTNQDSIVKAYSNKIYVLGRDSNSAVIVLDNSGANKDPIANYSLSELDSDGDIDIDGGFNGTNPYDIAFKSESEAYVGFYNSNFLLKINPLTGKRLAKIEVSFMKTITGATESDATVPNIVAVKLINNKLYILAQRLNAAFQPLEPIITIYDISTEEFVDTNTATPEIDGIILAGKNPSEMIYVEKENKLFVAHGGALTYSSDFSAIESTEIGSTGVEEINITTNITNGIIIAGTQFGGTTGGFGVSKILYDSKANKLYAAYSAFDFSANIKEINVTTKTVEATSLLTSNSFGFGDTSIDNNSYLYQINRSSSAPSIDVYNLTTKVLIKSIPTDLPLQSICTVQ